MIYKTMFKTHNLLSPWLIRALCTSSLCPLWKISLPFTLKLSKHIGSFYFLVENSTHLLFLQSLVCFHLLASPSPCLLVQTIYSSYREECRIQAPCWKIWNINSGLILELSVSNPVFTLSSGLLSSPNPSFTYIHTYIQQVPSHLPNPAYMKPEFNIKNLKNIYNLMNFITLMFI